MSETPKLDPSTMTQEQLMDFAERFLFHHRNAHKPGTYERDAYDAAFGLIVQGHGPWWRRALGWIIKRRATKKLNRAALRGERSSSDG